MELKPTPTLKGKSAKAFLKEIENKEITVKQKRYLDKCLKIFKKQVDKDAILID